MDALVLTTRFNLLQSFFSWKSYNEISLGDVHSGKYFPTPRGWLGHDDRIYGAQAADNPFAQLWMVYARADKRWAGAEPVSFLHSL